ncbi:hypothetical protein KD050_07405 [Psychrobacillus sp. INOP01]|uniref:hypothetical protein n=1 Tax=Psychrobacillus sp. INOP01 TaxID=2829187 RepID=UPI001BA812E9|nr:hypothetical protein [Psychrobacillus sp. INOP01]QUG43056.1 hypothetical protein KD050_07405 [Psychrobacillus sp. INOP01]
MLNNFSPLFKENSFNSPKMYLAIKQDEQNVINQLIQHAKKSIEGAKHTVFIQEYYSLYEDHIDSITTILKRRQPLSEKLSELLNRTEEATPEEKIEFDGYTFYATFGYEGWTFISPLGYDKYLEKDTYLILIYNQTPKGFWLAESAIGYTSMDIESLRNHPNYLVEQFNKFDKLTTVEEIMEHHKKCIKLLLECFNVKKKSDLYALKPSYRNKVLGEPHKLLQSLMTNRNENIIQLCLSNNHVTDVTSELIELVRNQHKINWIISNEELLADDELKNDIKSLEQRNETLFLQLKVSQELLDVYVSYLPSDL